MLESKRASVGLAQTDNGDTTPVAAPNISYIKFYLVSLTYQAAILYRLLVVYLHRKSQQEIACGSTVHSLTLEKTVKSVTQLLRSDEGKDLKEAQEPKELSSEYKFK
ncbi:hypothetical protein Clacol_009501 [Clathrus columnatus]|uniref:Uncharacterized protein n=1 Tax=Clathrus columnatus TaxID=1419009 RepID=A0AAV5ALB2_9AGAM|nr:hypothetical protein Clacol_009501 [Clathrus columnatus]